MFDKHEDFEGRVVAVRERNGYDDSDFYALTAVDTEDGVKFEWKMTGTTRAAYDLHVNRANATPEVYAEYARQYEVAAAKFNADQAEYEAATPAKGKRVKVVAGRKHKGEEGEVRWVGKDQYAKTYGTGYGRTEAYRVGVKFDGEQGLVFMAMDNVRVVGYEDFGTCDPGGMAVGAYAFGSTWPRVRALQAA